MKITYCLQGLLIYFRLFGNILFNFWADFTYKGFGQNGLIVVVGIPKGEWIVGQTPFVNEFNDRRRTCFIQTKQTFWTEAIMRIKRDHATNWH